MFCRSCWANVPDSSLRCPRCEADPRATPPAPAAVAGAASPAARRATASPPLPPKSKGLDIGTLTLVLAGLIVAVAAGPSALRWFSERGSASDRDGRAGAAPTGARAPVEARLPAATGPAAPVGGPEAVLAREAFQLYQEGRVAEACERYRDLANRTSGEDVRRDLSRCLARLGRDAYQANLPEQAAEQYRRAIEAFPSAPELWLSLALAHAKARNLGGAQGVLEQAARSFPDNMDILYLLADVQERQGRTREAAETLRRLLAREPAHPRARSLLASLEREQKVEGGYWAQESRHFLVRYEGGGGIDLGRSVVDVLEEAHDSIGRDLGAFPSERIQVGIYAAQVFGDVIGAPPHLIAGAYDGKKLRLNLAASNAYSRDLTRLVRHEYAHAVIHIATNGRAPIWLHEGLAQVMEPRSAPRYLEVSVPREYLTLNGIERLSRTGDAVALASGYGLTHVAVEYLVDRGGLSSVRDFLARLGRGEALPEAMRQSFGFGPDEVEARLLAVAGKS